MNAGEKLPIKIGFPFGLYLKQLFSANTYVRYINPFSFWRRYRINHLESCCDLNTVRHLERCYQLDLPEAKPTKIWSDRECIDVLIYSILQQAELNTIYISQPPIELKYRGVSYYTRDVVNININIVEIDPNAVKLNSFGRADDSNNINASEKYGSD